VFPAAMGAGLLQIVLRQACQHSVWNTLLSSLQSAPKNCLLGSWGL